MQNMNAVGNQLSNSGSSFLEKSFLNPLSKEDKVSVVASDYFPVVKSYSLPSYVFSQIVCCADFDTLKALLAVSKGANGVVSILNDKRREAVKGVAFGKEEWFKYFGLDIGKEPMLPCNIVGILNSLCSMDPTKKVGVTHVFTLIPRGLSLESFGQLAKKYSVSKTGYEYVYKPILKELKAPNEKSYWALMSREVFMPKDVLDGSRSKSFVRQQEMISELAQNAKVNYEVPRTLEAAVIILTHQVRSGERLFSNNPLSYTRCLEKVDGYQVVVGGFGPSGLLVHNFRDSVCDVIGVAALRKFRPLVLG